MSAPAAWLFASAGAASLPTARPVWALSTRTWPSQVSTSTSITCTELGTPAPATMLLKVRSIQPNTRPMKPAWRGGDQFAPRRVRAGDRRPRCGPLNLHLQFFNRKQRRRHDRGGDAAAARARSFRQVRVSDADFDVLWLQVEGLRHRIRDHAARAGADVLHRATCDDVAAFDRQLHRGAGLPQIEPVARGDA